jgi:predicted DNA-binding protein (MmcQ/YjbR family)
MTPAAIRKLCLSLSGATETMQWGDARVFKVGGKMFAVLRDVPVAVSFKASDESFRLLTELPGLRPAPHLARAQWVKLEPLSALPDKDLVAYLRRAYDLVRAALPKKARDVLGPAVTPTTRTASKTSPARRSSRALSRR